jgi:hypothetical protein
MQKSGSESPPPWPPLILKEQIQHVCNISSWQEDKGGMEREWDEISFDFFDQRGFQYLAVGP